MSSVDFPYTQAQADWLHALETTPEARHLREKHSEGDLICALALAGGCRGHNDLFDPWMAERVLGLTINSRLTIEAMNDALNMTFVQIAKTIRFDPARFFTRED